MTDRSNTSRRLAGLFSAVALLLPAAASAQWFPVPPPPGSPDPDVFYACQRNSDSLLVLDIKKGSFVSCRWGTSPVSWSSQGPQGVPGPIGPVGPRGPVGATGATGAVGAPGPMGPMGIPGPMGAPGVPGAPGPMGPMGPMGVPGTPGAPGPIGPMGPAGADGAPGTPGATGPAGATGPMGPAGPQGPAGPVTPDLRFGINTGNAANGREYDCVLGEIMLTAAAVAPGLKAEGQLLPIASNTALFSLLGTNFGGDGRTTFALPDLQDAAPNGLTYFICTQGIFPSRS